MLNNLIYQYLWHVNYFTNKYSTRQYKKMFDFKENLILNLKFNFVLY